MHLITKFEYFCLTPDTKSCSRAKTLFSANASAAAKAVKRETLDKLCQKFAFNGFIGDQVGEV